MNPIVKIFAKHHVAAYFLAKYADDETGAIACTMRDPFGRLVISGLTSHFVDRVDDVPYQMREIRVEIPQDYKKYYVDGHKAFDIAAVLEWWFWKDAGIEVLNTIHKTGNMQVGIDLFYENYSLSDEVYDRDNFRKQLQRNGVVCPKHVYGRPDGKKRVKIPKVTPALAIHLTRLYDTGKFTFRDLGGKFNLSHETVRKHVHKSA